VSTSTLIKETTRKFVADPASATAMPAVTGTLVDGRALLSAGSFQWEADLGPAIGGGNLAPSPTAYLLGALAGCAVAFINDTLAPQLGLALDSITAVARCRTDARGLLGMAGALPDMTDIELDVTIGSNESDARMAELHRAWVERCPIFLALTKPNAVATTFSMNPVPGRNPIGHTIVA
jgi:uncharacterized OsmC-like protein